MLNKSNISAFSNKFALTLVVALLCQSTPTFFVTAELRKFLPQLILLLYLFTMEKRQAYTALELLGISAGFFALIFLGLQNILLRTELAYLSNLFVYVLGLILSKDYRVQKYLSFAIVANGFLQVAIEFHYYIYPEQMLVKRAGFVQALDIASIFRFTGSFGDPNYFGGFLFFCVVLISRNYVRRAILFIAGILSVSKGAALAFIFVAFRTIKFNFFRLVFVLFSGALIMAFIIMQRDGFSVDSNRERFEALVNVFKLNFYDPSLMLGEAIVAPLGRPMVVHNFFIQTLYTNLFLFVSLFTLLISRFRSPFFGYFVIMAMLLDFSASPIFLFLFACFNERVKK